MKLFEKVLLRHIENYQDDSDDTAYNNICNMLEKIRLACLTGNESQILLMFEKVEIHFTSDVNEIGIFQVSQDSYTYMIVCPIF